MEIPFSVTINKTIINITDRSTWRKAVARGDAFFAAIEADDLPVDITTGPVATIVIPHRSNRVPPPRHEGPTKAEIAEAVLRTKGEPLTVSDLAAAMIEAGWKTESPIGPPRNRTLENPLSGNKNKFVKINGKWGLVEWENGLPYPAAIDKAEAEYLRKLNSDTKGDAM